MATKNLDDQNSKYQQALTAYTEQDYEVAATLIDQAVDNLPDDPNSHLLRGHIYYVLQQFQIAKSEYEKVCHLTDDQDILGSATNYIEIINQSLGEDKSALGANQLSNSQNLVNDDADLLDLAVSRDLDNTNFEQQSFGNYQLSTDPLEDMSMDNPFESDLDNIQFEQLTDNFINFDHDPFALDQSSPDSGTTGNGSEALGDLDLPLTLDQPFVNLEATDNGSKVSEDLELPAFWQADIASENIGESPDNNHFDQISGIGGNQMNAAWEESNLSANPKWENTPELMMEEDSSSLAAMSRENLPVSNHNQENQDLKNDSHFSTTDNFREQIAEEIETSSDSNLNTQISSSLHNNIPSVSEQEKIDPNNQLQEFDDDSFDLEAFESAFGADSFINDEEANHILSSENLENNHSNIEFLGDFEEFDDLGSIPNFNLEEDSSYGNMELVSDTKDKTGNSGSFTEDFSIHDEIGRDEELFSITGAQEAVPVFTQSEAAQLEANPNVEQGLFAFFDNAPLNHKPWYMGGVVCVSSMLAAAAISFVATTFFSPPEQRESARNTGWTMAAMVLVGGLTSGMTAGLIGNLTLKQFRRTTKDLQTQFDAVREGNLNVQATVYSEDELGYLAASFNDMARVIFMTTNEAQRKAIEQEEAKENLQRQVIRLLDDVEGAARGDLTVQAEVTADVLGAVADAFNLTIQNLRDIVQQVKVAARDVTKGSTNSETFARALSGDALRQAEELGVTLNSVQKMTELIQRVAESAKEAETVARDASVIALKGGEAVENTVAGILEIRETVAETTRKVKRLAESSQEINSIIALVSQIASRTNLLALNASIEAVRAGEAGRGFAIVADEVRQLADKSAKSLKDIEQIVMQIQSETSSVMTAMEEGTQQVIKGTKLAEEAKLALDNIIQVANHIDHLVGSITSDTVEQTETSSAVAQVMQSVELTAQHTSQEAQRVSGGLQHLVGVSRDLIASVERFRVETIDSK